VDVSSVQNMFNQFKAKTGFKHILSFGGWAFSTGPETYPIFRTGVTAAQRQTFATNVANVRHFTPALRASWPPKVHG
jgi:chitinase